MISDLRFAFRMLVKTPGFSVVAFLAIALGLGVNTTIFGIVNALLLRPLPIGKANEVVQVFTTDSHFTSKSSNSWLNFLDYQKDNTVFTGMAAYRFAITAVTRGTETSNAFGQLVTGNYFDLLQVPITMGRGFLPEEDSTPNGHPVAVLGDKFWKKMGGDPSIVGSTISLNGRQFTVIGIAPANFAGMDVGVAPDLWVPMSMHGWILPGGDLWFTMRRALSISTFARLKPGVSLAEAQAQMKTVAQQLEQAYPDVNRERSVTLVPAETAKSQGLGGPNNENGASQISILLVVAAGSILVIACANVANLLLARATTREREMAVRLALGAGRGRVVRQLLTESLVLAVIGGIGGVILAYWLGDVLITLLPPTPVPLAINPRPDGRVLIFALALAVFSGMLFGLAPALQTARWDLTQGLRERAGSMGGGGGIGRGLLKALVIAQIAVSLLLLIGSALFLKAFHKAQAINPGFRTDNLCILTFDPNLAGYDKDRATQLARNVLDQVRRDARVASADLGQWVPLGFGGEGRTILIEGRSETDEHNRKMSSISPITPGYFETMGITLVRGRLINEHDCEKNAPLVAVIDETMIKQFWPNEDPLGRRFEFLVDKKPIEVVGVVRNVKAATLGEVPTPMVYIPFVDMPDGGMSLFVHTQGASGPVLKEMHRIVRDTDIHIPITYEKTVQDHMAFALWPSWMGAIILGSLGVLALVLASIGVYGVMAYSVSQRTRELGIRMALGAQANQVLQLVLRQGMVLAGIGLLIGSCLALAATRLVGALLYGVNPNDPLIFVGVTILLALAALAACYFPARRALKIDPVIALRFD